MGYIETTWVSEAPSSRGMGWGHAVFLTSGSAPSNCSNPQLVTSSNYTEYISSSSYEYIALGSYFKNFTGSPTNNTYVYWMGDGRGITGTLEGTGLAYTLNFAPFTSIDKVYVDPTGGQNWQEIVASGVGSCQSGYIARTGAANIYDGRIQFLDDDDDGGPYFDSGGTNYSGLNARNIIAASGGRFRTLATQGGFGVAAQDLKDYDIQVVCPLYNTAGNGTGLENTPAYNDLRNALTLVAGNRRFVVWALPKSASPHSDYGGTSYDYNQFRNYIGQDKNAIVFYADVSTGTNGTGLDDPAACLLGRICDNHPHISLTLDPITISLASRENDNDKAAWDAGQILCVFQKSDLGFSTDQLNYGFTFAGTSPSNRLENVRCKYLTQFNIEVDLWSLLSSHAARINKAGLRLIMSTINGTLDKLLSQGIIDDGPAERFVDIPLLRGTSAEWTAANRDRMVPAIIIRWPWANTVEILKITQFGEVI